MLKTERFFLPVYILTVRIMNTQIEKEYNSSRFRIERIILLFFLIYVRPEFFY